MLYYKNNDGVVHNMFEELDPKLDTALKEARQFYQDGLINPDILSIKQPYDDFYNTGKAAVTADPPLQQHAQRGIPEEPGGAGRRVRAGRARDEDDWARSWRTSSWTTSSASPRSARTRSLPSGSSTG